MASNICVWEDYARRRRRLRRRADELFKNNRRRNAICHPLPRRGPRSFTRSRAFSSSNATRPRRRRARTKGPRGKQKRPHRPWLFRSRTRHRVIERLWALHETMTIFSRVLGDCYWIIILLLLYRSNGARLDCTIRGTDQSRRKQYDRRPPRRSEFFSCLYVLPVDRRQVRETVLAVCKLLVTSQNQSRRRRTRPHTHHVSPAPGVLPKPHFKRFFSTSSSSDLATIRVRRLNSQAVVPSVEHIFRNSARPRISSISGPTWLRYSLIRHKVLIVLCEPYS